MVWRLGANHGGSGAALMGTTTMLERACAIQMIVTAIENSNGEYAVYVIQVDLHGGSCVAVTSNINVAWNPSNPRSKKVEGYAFASSTPSEQSASKTASSSPDIRRCNRYVHSPLIKKCSGT